MLLLVLIDSSFHFFFFSSSPSRAAQLHNFFHQLLVFCLSASNISFLPACDGCVALARMEFYGPTIEQSRAANFSCLEELVEQNVFYQSCPPLLLCYPNDDGVESECECECSYCLECEFLSSDGTFLVCLL